MTPSFSTESERMTSRGCCPHFILLDKKTNIPGLFPANAPPPPCDPQHLVKFPFTLSRLFFSFEGFCKEKQA